MKTNTSLAESGFSSSPKSTFPEYFPLEGSHISCFLIEVESNIKQKSTNQVLSLISNFKNENTSVKKPGSHSKELI